MDLTLSVLKGQRLIFRLHRVKEMLRFRFDFSEDGGILFLYLKELKKKTNKQFSLYPMSFHMCLDQNVTDHYWAYGNVRFLYFTFFMNSFKQMNYNLPRYFRDNRSNFFFIRFVICTCIILKLWKFVVCYKLQLFFPIDLYVEPSIIWPIQSEFSWNMILAKFVTLCITCTSVCGVKTVI